MNNLLTLKEAATLLSISPSTIRKLVKEGKLKAVIITDRGDKRFDPRDLQQFINNQKTER